ncbi:MBL fold metallo-hydrolase [Pseudalkalibacillus sp. R45]|uniref:MBL fold metallo-hydrolase n=1 Tax=Pseudalkalibacillus sp. R45 TaxID=3457433 RepID=UPI003FCDA98C
MDPLDQIDFYIETAKEEGLGITHVIDTHVHADHISGARKLAEATGAELVMYEETPAQYNFTKVGDGDVISLGNVIIEVMHTPGHTPEHICLLVTDRSRGPEPWFVLTGHTLMIGDVGRPDLVSVAEESVKDLHDSLFNRLLHLDDYIEILPGAYSGSP